jgi:hypothetical protein
MDQQQEQLVMQSFYDRIFQMVTYAPQSGPSQGVGMANPATTLVQLVTDGSINLDDYKNMLSPDNVNGDMSTAEAFYDRFDLPGGTGTTYQAGETPIGALYDEIVRGADSDIQPSAQQLAEYQKARDFLYTTVTTTDKAGKKVENSAYTEDYANYLAMSSAYAKALEHYNLTYLNFDMTNSRDQRKFEAQAPVLQNAINTAWDNWQTKGNKAQVEQALAVLASSDNDIVANIIDDAQKLMQQSAQTSTTGTGGSWWLMYGSPSSWLDSTKSTGWMSFSLNSNYLHTSDSSYYAQYEESAGSSFLGLIGWNESSSGSTSSQSHHMEGDNLAISAEMLTVTIVRPWFNNALFATGGWYEKGQKVGWISEGGAAALAAGSSQLMPVVPTAFVLVKDVSITANWTTQDSSSLTTAVSASGGFNFGPFHAGGSGSGGSSNSSSTSTFSGGTLSIPDAQIVAFVSQITPLSPPNPG